MGKDLLAQTNAKLIAPQCLTGTPIINKISDMFALCRLMQMYEIFVSSSSCLMLFVLIESRTAAKKALTVPLLVRRKAD